MRKSCFIIFSLIIFALFSVPLITISYSTKVKAESILGFESFSNSLVKMLSGKSLQEDANKVFYKEDLTNINNTLMVDATTFGKITNTKVKLGLNSCEIERENNTVKINANENYLLVNNNLVLSTIEPIVENNKLYFPLENVARELGYSITETNEKLILINPYQTKRLVVSSPKNIKDMGAINKVEGYSNLHVLQYKTEEDCKKALNYYNSLNDVDWAEPDIIYSVNDYNDITNNNSKTDNENNSNNNINSQTNNINDTQNNNLNKIKNSNNSEQKENSVKAITNNSSEANWNIKAIGAENYVNYLNSLGTLPQVIVAVLDTGIDTDHEWFRGRIAEGGVNCSTSQSSTSYAYEDVQGHGTHVSGTIAEITLDNVKILPIKIMDDDGYGATSQIITGINYVKNLKNKTQTVSGVASDYFDNLVTMNLSIGGISEYGSDNFKAYSSALIDCYNSGILPVVAAGNDGLDTTNVSPANVGCAITVSAVGKAGENNFYRPYWSNYGKFVDVCAPGENIISARVGGGTISMDGTSMAAPHVTANVALMFSSGKYPSNSSGVHAVENFIKQNTKDLGANGWDDYYGEGLSYLAYAYAEVLTDVVTFSNTELDHNGPFTINLNYNVSGAEIYYTTDGSDPNYEDVQSQTNINGKTKRYLTEVNINKTQLIKARAFLVEDNKIVGYSKVSSQVYIIDNKDIDNAYTVDNGTIISYNGVFNNVIVPSTYNSQTITAVGERAFISANPQTVTLPNTVTSIKRYGFYGCDNLQEVIGLGVTTIDDYAFFSSQNLLEVTNTQFENLKTIGKYAFANCCGLQEISLNNVTKVDYYAFCNLIDTAQNVTKINLPNVEIIGDAAFYGFVNLTNISVDNAQIIGSQAFASCGIINLELLKTKFIGNSCFENNPNLITANLPELHVLSRRAFYGCAKLEEVIIPNVTRLDSLALSETGVINIDMPEVETIGSACFRNCSKLVSFTAPKVKTIKAEAFNSCPKILEINLPSIVTLEQTAFYQIVSAKSITLSPYLTYISNYAFDMLNRNCVFYIYASTPAKTFINNFVASDGSTLNYVELEEAQNFNYEVVNNEIYIKGLTNALQENIVIPSFIGSLPVTKICEGAFENNLQVNNLNLPNVVEIEQNAFKNCTNLKTIYAPKLKLIGENCFNGCLNLNEVKIDNVTTINNFAFFNCPSLKQIKLNRNIAKIGLQAIGFVSTSNLTPNFNLIGYDGVAKTYATQNNISFHNVFSNLSNFYYNTYINNGVEEICITLVDSYTKGGIIIPSSYNGVTISKIDNNAFEDCFLITDVMLPSSIKTLGVKAFYNCTGLTNINLNYVTSIGEECFSHCENLQSVTINNVEAIENKTFAACYGLETVTLTNTKVIGDQAFLLCVGLITANIPKVETIRYNGFANCYRLKNINLNNVKTLGNLPTSKTIYASFAGSVFINCQELPEYIYLNNIQNLGGDIFAGSNAKNVVIGNSYFYYSQNTNYRPINSNLTIYGYNGSYAQTYANRYDISFVTIDKFSISSGTLFKDVLENNTCEISPTITGFNVKYQWYSYNNGVETLLVGENAKTLNVNTSKTGTYQYFVKVTNWDDKTLESGTYSINVLPSFKITTEYNNTRGSVTSSLQSNYVSSGGDITFTISCFEGCFVTEIIVDDVTLTTEEMQNALLNGYTFNNVTKDHSIKVNFGINTYKITVNYSENGAVYVNNVLVANGEVFEVEHGKNSVTFEFVGIAHYHAEQVLIDEVNLGRLNSYTFEKVKANHLLNVVFAENKHKIIITHNNNGSVECSGTLTDIKDNEERTFTITAEEGFFIESVKCNGRVVELNNNSFTIQNITEDINLEISFKSTNPFDSLFGANGTQELILFIGIFVGILVLIFVPIKLFKKHKK